MLLGCHESPLIVGFHDDDQFPSISPTSFPSARLIVFDLAREESMWRLQSAPCLLQVCYMHGARFY